MEVDITTILAERMVRDNKDLPEQLRRQKKTLEKLKCENKIIGGLISVYDVSVLVDIFQASSDDYFFKLFPHLKTLDRVKRQDFAEKIQEHGHACPRCKLKILYDRQWEGTVESSTNIHRKTLYSDTENQQDSAEAEHSHYSGAAAK